MHRYIFTEEEKEILIPFIEKRYISIFETFDMPQKKDMEAINEIKDEFENEESLLTKESRSMLCSIIDENIISPNAELMSDLKEMSKEDIDNMAIEYLQIAERVKYFMALKNKLYPYKKSKK